MLVRGTGASYPRVAPVMLSTTSIADLTASIRASAAGWRFPGPLYWASGRTRTWVSTHWPMEPRLVRVLG